MSLVIYAKNNKVSSSEDKVDVEVTNCLFTVKCDQENCTIKLNDIEVSKLSVKYGDMVHYEISKENYITEKGQLKVYQDIELNVKMQKLMLDIEYKTPGEYAFTIDKDAIYEPTITGGGSGGAGGNFYGGSDYPKVATGAAGTPYYGGEILIPAGTYKAVVGAGGEGKSYNRSDTGLTVTIQGDPGESTLVYDSENNIKICAYGSPHGAINYVSNSGSCSCGYNYKAADMNFQELIKGTTFDANHGSKGTTWTQMTHANKIIEGPSVITVDGVIYGAGGGGEVKYGETQYQGQDKHTSFGHNGGNGYLKLKFLRYAA